MMVTECPQNEREMAGTSSCRCHVICASSFLLASRNLRKSELSLIVSSLGTKSDQGVDGV